MEYGEIEERDRESLKRRLEEHRRIKVQ